jgi:chemotaxis protein CheD
MKQLVVGVGDGAVSSDPDSMLVTHALGSCIAVMVHDPVAHVGGLLHYMLPESSMSPEKSQTHPWMFADTGIPLLLQTVLSWGGEKRRLMISAAGGAQVMDDGGFFNIGKRNCLALRKAMWKAGLMTRVEEIGGNVSRTVRMNVATGRVVLHIAGQGELELVPARLVATIRHAQGEEQWH